MIKLTCMHIQRRANVCTWTYINLYVHIHTHSAHTCFSLDTCIRMRCPHIWVYASLHMCINVYILHKCLFMHEASCFCTCVYVCVSTHCFPPCISGHLPLPKRKAENKVPGAQKEKDEGCPRNLQFRRLQPPPGSSLPYRLKRSNDQLPLQPPCPCFWVPLCSLLKVVLQRERRSPLEGRDRGKAFVGWRGNLQECPNGKATLNRTFS